MHFWVSNIMMFGFTELEGSTAFIFRPTRVVLFSQSTNKDVRSVL